MTENSDINMNLSKIEKLLSTSSRSSIYDALSRIQLGEVAGKGTEKKLDIDLNGFTKHTSLSNATQKEHPVGEEIMDDITVASEPTVPRPAIVYDPLSSQKVSILCTTEFQIGSENILLKVASNELKYNLKVVQTNRHSEMIKSDINGSIAGIIILPPFSDINDIQIIINRHVSELWSYNGLGPIPFVLALLENNISSGSLTLGELEQSINTFMQNLTPITRGNYGFGVKCLNIKELNSEKDLKKILHSLSILLISYQRFKSRKTS
ncbi:MAG: hypothetical protein ACFFFH_03170 [Candidatus Thorarchaeota archaeon]